MSAYDSLPKKRANNNTAEHMKLSVPNWEPKFGKISNPTQQEEG